MSERYDYTSRIATGGMGEVWLARDTLLGRDVAIKRLKGEYADDPVFRERFAAEARNAAALHDRHIATVFDVGEETGSDGRPVPYLVMEYVDGKPLSDLLRDREPMPHETAKNLVGQAAAALSVAHARGIVHRDVKPANLLVTRDRTVKLTDFGIARAADAVALTGTGEVIGTPHYLAPEQVEGRAATPASDVYSLGVVLHECLTGARPFEADTPVATALAHLRQDPPPLPDDLPRDLRATAERALAKDPAQRFPDAAAFLAALEGRAPADDGTRVMGAAMIAAGAGAAAAAAPVAAAAATQVMAGRGTGAIEPDEERRRRRGVPAWILAAIAVPLIVLAAVLLFGGDGDEATPATTPSEAPSTPAETSAEPTPEPETEPEPEPETAQIVADDLIGLSRDEAVAALAGAGFTDVRVTEIENTEGEEQGEVVEVSPQGETALDTPVELVVWGPEIEEDQEEEPAPPEEGGPGGDGPGGPKDKPGKKDEEGKP